MDDESSDGTAELAGRLGATVLAGAPLPAGWVGKPWALDQGLRAATGEWVVTMDADVEPARGLPGALVERATRDGLDLVSVAGRFACPTAGAALAPPRAARRRSCTGSVRPGPIHTPRPSRVLANGQCTAFRRQALLDAGGYDGVGRPPHRRHRPRPPPRRRAAGAPRCWTAPSALTVRMHDDAADAWRHWGRSLPMPDATAPGPQLLDLATLLVAQALPLPRLLLGRGDALDVALLAVRLGTLAGTRRAYERADLPYWLSPLADPAAVGRVVWGAVRPGRTWRGRSYPR